jgi:hypothetical protein
MEPRRKSRVATKEIAMNLYHFQLIDPTGARREMKSARLNDIRAVWREIEALALGRAKDGGQIRVTNEAGGIVVLVGVSTALSLRAPRAA